MEPVLNGFTPTPAFCGPLASEVERRIQSCRKLSSAICQPIKQLTRPRCRCILARDAEFGCADRSDANVFESEAKSVHPQVQQGARSLFTEVSVLLAGKTRVPYAMGRTVRQLCTPHNSAFAYVIGDQVEKLDLVVLGSRTEAEDFFQKNHLTVGLRVLLRDGLARLAGKSGQAIFELRQAMGGGKTHSMIALGLLAKDPALRAKHLSDVPHANAFAAARVVAVEGRSIDRTRHIWGEIITQLDRVDVGSLHWKDGPKPPSEKEWVNLIGNEPVLILLDELPPYLDYAVAVGSGEANLGKLAKYALSNLFAAALRLPQCCIVVSSLSGTYNDSSSDLHDLANEASRQARPLTPVDLATDEIYRILQRRLFLKLPGEADIAAVTEAYRASIGQAITAQALPSTAKQLADEIPQTYPFHPSVKHVIALFRNNETFRQTRGLMQLASRMILSTWQRPADDVYLIGCQHLNLGIRKYGTT